MSNTNPTGNQTMTTYKLADGSPVAGEYGWVTETDYFDEDVEPVELIEEVWTRTSARTFWKFPVSVGCYGDGEDEIECSGDEEWVEGHSGWMNLCAAHREYVASLEDDGAVSERAAVAEETTP